MIRFVVKFGASRGVFIEQQEKFFVIYNFPLVFNRSISRASLYEIVFGFFVSVQGAFERKKKFVYIVSFSILFPRFFSRLSKNSCAKNAVLDPVLSRVRDVCRGENSAAEALSCLHLIITFCLCLIIIR